MNRNQQVVTNTELARKVSQLMDPELASVRNPGMVNTAHNVFQAVGRFVTTQFQSGSFESILIDVCSLGTFVRNAQRQFDFIPSYMLSLETKLPRQGKHVGQASDLKDPVKRSDLQMSRVANQCKITEALAGQVLVNINKAIGHFLLQEKRNVMLDLDMQRGMVLYFDESSARFIEKGEALKDQVLAVIDDTKSEGAPRRITEEQTLTRKLSTGAIIVKDDHDETRSVRSNARSLNIALSSVGKSRRRADQDSVRIINKPRSIAAREMCNTSQASRSSKLAQSYSNAKPTGGDMFQKAANMASQDDIHSNAPLSTRSNRPRDVISRAESKRSNKSLSIFSPIRCAKDGASTYRGNALTGRNNSVKPGSINDLVGQMENKGVLLPPSRNSYYLANEVYNTPRASRTGVLSPLNNPTGAFQQRKVSQGLQQLNSILNKPDPVVNPNLHTEIGFIIGGSPTRNLARDTNDAPATSLQGPIVNDVGKPITLKERLMRQKIERLNGVKNAEIKAHQDMMTLPSKARQMAQEVTEGEHPEMKKLVNTSTQEKNLGPDASPLGHDTFNILRTNKIMKAHEGDRTSELNSEINGLQSQRIRQRHDFEKQITDYRAFLDRQKQVKKQTQEANSNYWRLQMSWRKQQQQAEAQEAYNPHIQWTIEGHARALIENAKRQQDGAMLKQTLESQRRVNEESNKQERENELDIGRQMNKIDLKQKNLESELIAFKKNAFTKELTEAWRKQREFKRNMLDADKMF